MLTYGQASLEQNRRSLDQLRTLMTEAGFEAALAFSPQCDPAVADLDLDEEQPARAQAARARQIGGSG